MPCDSGQSFEEFFDELVRLCGVRCIVVEIFALFFYGSYHSFNVGRHLLELRQGKISLKESLQYV